LFCRQEQESVGDLPTRIVTAFPSRGTFQTSTNGIALTMSLLFSRRKRYSRRVTGSWALRQASEMSEMRRNKKRLKNKQGITALDSPVDLVGLLGVVVE